MNKIPNSWVRLRYEKKWRRNHYSLDYLFVENVYPQISCRYDITKILLIDAVFAILLMKYGTEETIRILKLNERDEYKEALEKDLKYRNANLYFCRRVFKFRKQLKYLKRLYALTGDTPFISLINFQCTVWKSQYCWHADRKLKHFDSFNRMSIEHIEYSNRDLKKILKELHYPEYIYFKD